MTDEGKGFDFLKILGNGLTSDSRGLTWARHPADESVYGRCALRTRRFGSSYAQTFASYVFFINVTLGASFEIDAANRLVDDEKPLAGLSESWECYELRSLRQSPNKDGRWKVDSFIRGFRN